MEPNFNYQQYYQQPDPVALGQRVSSVMRQVYLKMFLGLVVTALVSLYCQTTPGVMNFFYGNSWARIGMIVVWFGIAIGVNANRVSGGVATLLFYIFSVVTGLMFAPLLLLYTGASIAKTFFITAGVFGAMTVYGYFTSQDLSRWGSILVMCLIGLIIVSVVNIFLKSSGLEWVISAAGVLIFIGLTAWDTQQIKAIAIQAPAEAVSKLATQGALMLYLDFVNLFLYLLRFFGNRN